ncbi:MAG: hypothetical protein GX118_07325 [Arcobacter butzleri]|jgi:preprotein translocase subunit YajC|nr:hypothetical protein [Arcobacteraceae bacterium]MDY0365708.1 hypothetical protein [Arcobacteraceae bacterium]NLO17984.1 hypothetical protein [Aliarcobacter butzleri]
MKEIVDIVVFALFIIVLIYLIAGFNRQQVQKHSDKLKEIEKRNKKDDKTIVD